MSIPRLLSRWRTDPSIGSCFEVWHKLDERQGQFDPLPGNLHPHLVSALQSQGISSLYTHQSLSWNLVQQGHHIVVVTGTASGKTLCYNLPVLDKLLREPLSRALFLFPTRALAQDQRSTLNEFLAHAPDSETQIPLAVYDGDTPSSSRPAIRKKARLVISNPDMLHAGILPHHTSWAEFFNQLRYVVIDEIHAYRGVFGSHVANVLRRLKRIATHYGSSPQFILTSATIANPKELAELLVESRVDLVDNDGSSRGSRHFLMYNPPVINRELGLRRSALQESVRLAEDLLAYNVQTIIFGRSRRTVELILTYLRQRTATDHTSESDKDSASRISEPIRGYRSGYLPIQRREIERGLRMGDVRLVVATNALELGIDIGKMGASLLVGYPGTIAAT